jgi:hypothetical protein
MIELNLYKIYKINKLSRKHKLILHNLGESVTWMTNDNLICFNDILLDSVNFIFDFDNFF